MKDVQSSVIWRSTATWKNDYTVQVQYIFLFSSLFSGHVLSMPHDDSKICEKLFGHLNGNHMMAPFFVHLNKTLPWSPCSALYITEFFDNGYGMILLCLSGCCFNHFPFLKVTVYVSEKELPEMQYHLVCSCLSECIF